MASRIARGDLRAPRAEGFQRAELSAGRRDWITQRVFDNLRRQLDEQGDGRDSELVMGTPRPTEGTY